MAAETEKKPVYILDTNVLLYNPKAIFAFPESDVVIPDTVLAELDKIKLSRADRELRYRSREISRILFDLSESGTLTDGIPFGRGSTLTVVTFNPSQVTHELLNARNSDDRILAVALGVKQERGDQPVTIVTNDLNMLLKAQTLDIRVEHPGEEFAYGKIKRSLYWIKNQKRAISTVAIACALVLLVILSPQLTEQLLSPREPLEVIAPPELAQRLRFYEAQEQGYLAILANNPDDLPALVGLGNLYYEKGEIYRDPKYYQQAIEYYEKALEIDPNNTHVRTDLAVEYHKLGMHDIAIRELKKVLGQDPNHVNAHFNLGVILLEGKGDPREARNHFKQVLELTPEDSPVKLRASSYVSDIEEMLAAEGKEG